LLALTFGQPDGFYTPSTTLQELVLGLASEIVCWCPLLSTLLLDAPRSLESLAGRLPHSRF